MQTIQVSGNKGNEWLRCLKSGRETEMEFRRTQDEKKGEGCNKVRIEKEKRTRVRWADDVSKHAGRTWFQTINWKMKGGPYVQYCIFQD